MTIKLPNWLIFSIIVGLAILIFTSIRGCNNSTQALADNKILTHNLDSSIKKNKADSLKWKEKEFNYQVGLQVLDGQIKLTQTIDSVYKDSLSTAYARINILTNKHVPIVPNTDTSITTVPNAYIVDCESCFTELTNGKELVKRANAERDNLQQALQSKINLQDNRINDLTTQNKALQSTLTDAFSIAKKQEKELAPRRKLLFGLNAISISNKIAGMGGGFFYQNKLNMLWGIQLYGSNYGAIYTASYLLPLSLKRK